MSYFVLGNVYWTFNLLTVFCLFETLKMFYPPKELCKADTEGGPIVFTYVLFCVRKRILDFFFTSGFWHFLNLVLFDGVGWGRVGWDQNQKCPLIFFILLGI